MFSHVDCIACTVNKADKLADQYFMDKQQKYHFMKEVLQEIIQTDFDRAAPIIEAKMLRIAQRELGIIDFYKEEKKFFNDKLLLMEQQIEERLSGSEQILFDALKTAIAGNIIDFSALDYTRIDTKLVNNIIDTTVKTNFDEQLFARFKNELDKGKSLVYLGDNAGEIVFDKIFIKKIAQQYPHIKITFVTREKPISSDVTEEDAYYVGIDQYASIVNNGTDIAGTDLFEVSEQFKELFNQADVIISKGQGNFETLTGCGRNIYYLFLCKCDVFMKMLKVEKFTSMFRGEQQG